MHVVITTVEKVLFEGTADSLTAPGREGELTIRPDHVPLITPLKKGKLKLATGESNEEYDIEHGLLEVNKEGVVVLL